MTGQPDWCSSKMRCATSVAAPRYDSQCPVEHWCVCQWAFASYLQRAGGCDKIQNIVCEATNMVALVHYRQRAAADSSIAAALQCLEKRCNLN